jgi:CHAT domain-containing protein/Tfp pilus assembly protein PilF
MFGLTIEATMRSALRFGAGIVPCAGLVALLWLLPLSPAWGQGEDAEALSERAVKLYRANRYAEAEPLFRRAASITEKRFGPEHLNTALSLNNLALVYDAQRRYAEAEPLFRRVLEIREKVLGPEHPDTALSLNALAQIYNLQDHHAKAESLHRRALAIREKILGSDHSDTAMSLNNLGEVYKRQGRYSEAEPLFRRALAIWEKVLGPEHPNTAHILNNLATVNERQGHYAKAEPFYRRTLAIREKMLGPEHPNTAYILNELANVTERQGHYAEAEPLYRRALAIREKVLGPEHPDTAVSLAGLARVYRAQARYSEAELFLRRALAAQEKVFGPEHFDTGTSLNGLAIVYSVQGRYAEAEPLYRRALAIWEKILGPEHPHTLGIQSNLAIMYQDLGRDAEAESLHRRVLEIREKVLGPEHFDVAASLHNLAIVYSVQGRYAEAEPLYRRALAVREKVLGPEAPETAASLANLGNLKLRHQDWPEAYNLLNRATAIHIRRAQRGGDTVGPGADDKHRSEIGQFRSAFAGLIQAAAGIAKANPDRRDTLAGESFMTAQWAQHSTAATALAAMAARFAKGDGTLAGLVRQRQDLVADYRKLDKLLVAASSKPPAQRKAADEVALRSKIDATSKQIDAIDLQLKQLFPEYAAIASPEPLTIAEAQKHLREDEALYQVFVDSDRDRIFAWVVTKQDARFQALDLTAKQMAEHVETLRCGLDASRWQDERGLTRTKTREQCIDLIAGDATERLPFDLKRAHALYQGLFGPFADLIKRRRLLIVADGALTALPFQVLLTAPPDESAATPAERYSKAAWLVAEHPITVLPSVSSMKALREAAGRSPAPKAYAAFANPLLTGRQGTDRSAWGKVACPPPGSLKIAATALPPRGTLRAFFRGGIADAEALTKQPPLPETTDEVCAVAASLGAGTDAILLGAKITETAIKELSRKGDLKRFRIVHFATHGLIATETKQFAAGSLEEPGLIMTPPKTATEQDDGLLTASEVAQLDLNADFVILSACNTAAGDGAPNAQALSGLTRAFLYAGARALLVSHWAVDTWAAVDVVTGTFATLQQEPALGRAEALRRAMLAQIAKGGKRAHPSYWAPFVIVGEGS